MYKPFIHIGTSIRIASHRLMYTIIVMTKINKHLHMATLEFECLTVYLEFY